MIGLNNQSTPPQPRKNHFLKPTPCNLVRIVPKVLVFFKPDYIETFYLKMNEMNLKIVSFCEDLMVY